MRIVIADDSALVRAGIVAIVERAGHDVIGEAASATELEACVTALAATGQIPDLVMTDVRMPPNMSDDGLRAAARLRKQHPVMGILVVSQYVAPAYAAELFGGSTAAGGGLGYLLKDRIARVADFLRSLALVADGGIVIDPEVASRLIARRRSSLANLTAREREVLAEMANGLSNAQIGEKFYLSPGAVSKHVAAVFAKLGLGPDEENRRVRAVLTFLTETADNQQ